MIKAYKKIVMPIFFRYFLCLAMLSSISARSQCPVPSFTTPATNCINGNVEIANASATGNTYAWDFCSGDLATVPSASSIFTDSFLARSRSFKMIQSSGNWYGFAIDQVNNSLLRFDFGTSLSSIPTMTNLGNLGNQLQNAFDLDFYREGSLWYALIANTATDNILKLQFGTDIESVPITTDLGSLGVINEPNGLFVVMEGGLLTVFVTNGGTSQITMLEFGSSINNAPSVTVYPVAIGSGLRGISLIKECDRWFGVVTSYGNGKLLYLDFVNGITQAPSIGELTSGLAFPATVTTALEGGSYYAFIQSAFPGNLYRMDFGSSITDKIGTVTDLGNLSGTGVSADNFAFTLAHQSSDWFGFFVDNAGSRLMRMPFATPCSATTTLSTDYLPIVSYTQAGTYKISQTVTDINGHFLSHANNIIITSSIAPDINFTSQNICVNSAINFTSQNTSGNITNYSWDFGDTNTSAQPNPSHIYATAGTYPIELQVIASNGCTNFSQSSLTVYNQPVSNFSLPFSPLSICSNQLYSYTNTSTFDPASNPTWEWSLNGTPVSTAANLTQAFSTTSNQDIKLKASIPGCSDEKTQNITGILVGPLVDFSATTGCQGSALQFTNNTSGTVISYSWDFGDGNMSSQISPSNTYLTFGNFSATLHADNGVCNNSVTKPITIYSKPQPNFSLDLPPFSCQGTPSQFNDLTPNPTDSNLSSWSWNFGDAANGTSGQRNPLYTYSAGGPYNVSLDVTTNFGCSAAVQKTVTITTAPPVNFNNTAACINQPTQFTDASGVGVKSWLWKIDNSIYMISNPVHTFTSSGSHTAQLTITGANDCIAQVIKTLMVPVAVTPNFSVENDCSGKPSAFLDITSGTDPVVIRDWDFAGLGIANGAAPKFTFPAGGSYTVKLNTTHQSGCIYLGAKTITIGTSPTSIFTSSMEGGPPPLTIKFSNSSTGASSYLWKFNDMSNTTSLQVEPSFTFTELGEYQVELTSFGQQNCTDTFIKSIYIVEPRTDLSLTNFELLSDPNSGSLRPLVTIKNNGNIAITNVSILIDLSGGGSIKEKMQINLQPNQSFTQALVSELLPKGLNYICAQVNVEEDENLVDNKKCSTLAEDVILFAPYPNPSQGQLYIDWIAASGDVASIVIFNSTGENAYDKKITATQPGLSQIILNISNLAPGIYFVVFSYGGITKTHRFMMN